MRQAVFFLATFAAVLPEAAGCSIICSEGCRYGKQLTWHKRTTQMCRQAGQTMAAETPEDLPGVTSCNLLKAQASKKAAQGVCQVERSTTGGFAWDVLCEAEGACEIDWGFLSDTCLCTPRPDEPCDGKCDALPLCREGEELPDMRSPEEMWECGEDELKEGTCRTAEVCCVASVCRKKQTVPVVPVPVLAPVPVPAQGCRTPCGRRVASGETVQGDGPNYCNRCTCSEGKLSCTKRGCTEMQDPVCLPKGSACKITLEEGIQVMDRSHECPDLTRCTRGQSHARFGFSFCDEKPRLCEQMMCIWQPCACLPRDRIVRGAVITVDTELFTVEQAKERWTVRLPDEAAGKIVGLWFGRGENVPKELVVQGWTSDRLENAHVEGLGGADVLATRPIIDTDAKAMMVTLTPAAVRALAQGSTLTLIDVHRLEL